MHIVRIARERVSDEIHFVPFGKGQAWDIIRHGVWKGDLCVRMVQPLARTEYIPVNDPACDAAGGDLPDFHGHIAIVHQETVSGPDILIQPIECDRYARFEVFHGGEFRSLRFGQIRAEGQRHAGLQGQGGGQIPDADFGALDIIDNIPVRIVLPGQMDHLIMEGRITVGTVDTHAA